jgi:two-component system chemotaxis response regulator CheB
MAKKDIVVIGGSSGSHAPLRNIIEELPADFPASIFITTHVPSHSSGYLSEILEKTSRLPIAPAVDGQPIERGRIYVAVPDHHLLIVDGTVRLGNGPRENMTRPAIDPLFRSAALSYGPRAVGVLLSGLLNDGASGLSAIKACGGTAIVQHPLDALSDSMPLAALEAVQPDRIAPAAELAEAVATVVSQDAGKPVSPPDNLLLEVEIAAGARLGSDELVKIADPSALTCPDCNGVLSEVRGESPLRYRCQIGHANTAAVLEARSEGLDEALRVALRVMEERVTLVTRMAEDARRTGRETVAELYQSRAEEYSRYAQVLRHAAIAALRDGRSSREGS